MRAIIYSVHPFERIAFDRANSAHIHELTYLAAPLDPITARLAEGYVAVVSSISDIVDATMLQLLANHGFRLIALRSAGYNNLDVTAAERMAIRAVYVPAYTPHAVAEHAGDGDQPAHRLREGGADLPQGVPGGPHPARGRTEAGFPYRGAV